MGITFCTLSITITTEGAGQTVQGTAQDRADNMTTAVAKVSLDKTPPVVTITSPVNGAYIDGKTAHVEGTVADALSGVTSVSCNGVDATVSGSVFNCEIPLQNGTNTLIAQVTDAAGNSSSSGVNVTMSNAEIKILEPANFSFFNINTVTVSGTVAAGSTGVTVNGIPATLSAGNWSASIPLQEGNNTLTAVAVKTGGAVNTASIQVTLDTTPPRVTVAAPIDGFKTTEDHITVTGIVNDIVVGTVNSGQAQVTVNNIAAQVANRTYTAADIPLQTGLNTIQVIGRDQVGNSATATIKVTREAVSAPFIKLLSGNNQTGAIATALAEPLVVQLLNGQIPVANTPVIFKITENDGYLQLVNGRKLQLIAANTDVEGKAQAMLTLGNRAGAGNNVVEAYATGYQGTALFTASGMPAAVANINVDAGANQFGAINNTLPLPFVAVVTDAGHNRLGGVPVTFTVTQGGGNINGLASYETVSDSNGRVLAVLSLGPEAGQDNNVVEANFPGNSGFAAAFAASGKIPGDPAQTAISGVVQDNSNNPIPGVTMRLLQLHLGSSNNQPVEVATPTVTDANGQFKLAPAPVGFFKLMVDGATATETGKRYPALEYDIVTVAGQDNGVGMPIYLPVLDQDAKLCVDATTGGTLKMASSPGFSLTLAPGAATFPGGSKSGCVSVTPVNPDKVPMVPGFGQQPRYVVTVQPIGTTFNPPAALTIPNMDGLAPHAKTEMYSYDHDLAAFVAIGSGTVSADGSVIASDPGIGVIKAGWQCAGDPNIPGSAGHCPFCRRCVGTECIEDNTKKPEGACKYCKEGRFIDVSGYSAPGGVDMLIIKPIFQDKIPFHWGETLFDPFDNDSIDIAAYCDGTNWKAKVTKAYPKGHENWGLLTKPNKVVEPTSELINSTTNCSTLNTMQSNLWDIAHLGQNDADYFYYIKEAVKKHEDEHVRQYETGMKDPFIAFKAKIEAMTIPLKEAENTEAAKNIIRGKADYSLAVLELNVENKRVQDDSQTHIPPDPFVDAELGIVRLPLLEITLRKITLGCQ